MPPGEEPDGIYYSQPKQMLPSTYNFIVAYLSRSVKSGHGVSAGMICQQVFRMPLTSVDRGDAEGTPSAPPFFSPLPALLGLRAKAFSREEAGKRLRECLKSPNWPLLRWTSCVSAHSLWAQKGKG